MVHTEGSALLQAVWQGKFRLTRLLLEGGAYINEGNAQGETPLIAACVAPYGDPHSRPRMVKYLLENGADPNIPDKTGKSALMRACADGAGAEVAAVLLAHGADPSARDYAGASALVHALNRGDRETLQLLLDACTARGKEVIIIATDTSPSGTKKTRQYLNALPSPGAEERRAPASCMSPSDIEVRAAPSPGGSEKDEERDVFTFSVAPRPGGPPLPRAQAQEAEEAPPAPAPPPKGRPKQLKRLNSEPWGLAAPSASASAAAHAEKARGPEDRLLAEMNGLSLCKRPPLSRRHSVEGQEPSCLTAAASPASGEEGSRPDAAWAERVQFGHLHQALPRRSTAPEAPEGGPGPGPRGPAPHRLNCAEHHEGDSLAPDSTPGSPDSGRVSLERRRYGASPLTLPASSSRESLESVPSAVSPVALRRRAPGLLERRGSCTLLLDHLAHSRPGFLPPLHFSPHPPLRDLRANGKPPPGDLPARGLVPVAPASPKGKRLLRRHSMQPEQMKQLASFQSLLAQGDSAAG
ncbi:ankyrin repeat domain-containing protein 34A [Varanus komodoensis]|uniref:Ankyrin repeat domain 34A n=1 Tax=Varanus komodoensis TaxID=61221 RepID=A0A8D2IY17_VARKO|nr:ankyrin repeat domain-containing protein 34A [Varanus komodoensis]